jgi:AraC-like DNA-binding protein
MKPLGAVLVVNKFNLDEPIGSMRFEHFLEVLDSLYVPVGAKSDFTETFRYTRNQRPLGNLAYATGVLSKVTITRTASDIARSRTDEYMKLIIPLTGTVVFRQDAREALATPGYFYVDDPARPYEEIVLEDLSYLSVLLPRNIVRSRFAGYESITAVRFGPELPYSKLARDFLLSLSSVSDSIEQTSAAHLGSVAFDLIMAALWERSDRKGTPHNVFRSAQFQRAREFIDQHLQDPLLSLSMVAAALGVSIRYIRYLLSEQGFHYRNYVLERRLDRCARDLEDPRLAHRSVTTIAYSWGFSDGAHFSRSFKVVHGMSPREYRASKFAQ